MSDLSPRLNLPYVAPAQAQKHVTVNEAFRRLDAITQLTVEEFDALDPPPAPELGQIWSIGATPNGIWSGQAGHLAVAADGGGWLFILPREGWQAYGKSDGVVRSFGPTGWQVPATSAPAQLGISATPDSTNRLSVSSPATLLSHAGSDHQLKINKAGPSDTASLLYQTNWTGHAEMGLAGGDDFQIKVSDDGNNWHLALSVDRLTGFLTGDGIQSSVLAAPDGVVLTAGAYGLGKAVDLAGDDVDNATTGGFYIGYGGAHASASGAGNPFPNASYAFTLQTIATADGDWVQTAQLLDPQNPEIRIRSRPSGTAAGVWTNVALQTGTAGSDANGEFIRQSDGTQFCTIGHFALSQASADLCEATWTFPRPFAAGTIPCVTATLTGPSNTSPVTDIASDAAPMLSELGAPVVGPTSQGSVQLAVSHVAGGTNFGAADNLYLKLCAIGRWK